MDIVPFSGALPRLDRISDLSEFVDRAKSEFSAYHARQLFTPGGAPALFIYHVEDGDVDATGLIATTSVQDYLNGKVLQHEEIIIQKQQVQIDLLQQRQAAVKPVLLLHRHQEEIRQYLHNYKQRQPAFQEFIFSPIERHRLWQVDRPEEIAALQRLFRRHVPAVAIADGHHRFSSFADRWNHSPLSERSRYAYVLSAYFPDDELRIEAFHRITSLPPGLTVDRLRAQLQQLGQLELLPTARMPEQKHEMCLWLAGHWYRFCWKPELRRPVRPGLPVLDVDLLNRHILSPLLHIYDLQSDEQLQYMGSDYDLHVLEANTAALENGIAFALYPISSDDFMQIAQAGIRLSPKATFFRPRLKNGLIVQQL